MTLRIDTANNGIVKECSQLVVMEKKPIVSCKYTNLEVHGHILTNYPKAYGIVYIICQKCK